MPPITTATYPNSEDTKQPATDAASEGQGDGAPNQPASSAEKVSLSSDSSSSPSPSRNSSPEPARSPSPAGKEAAPASKASDGGTTPKGRGSESPRRSASRSPSPSIKRRHSRKSPEPRVEPPPARWRRSKTASRGGHARSRTPAHHRGGGRRSRTPVVRRDAGCRSRTPFRPTPFRRPTTLCWFGRQCFKLNCYFVHPDGRDIDDVASPPRATRRDGRSRGGAKSQRRSSPSRSRSHSRARARSSSRPAGVSKSKLETPEKAPATPVPGASARSASPSFRGFVLGKLGKNVSPKEAVDAYERHCQQLLEKSIEPLKGTGLFFDMYHPISLLRRFDLRARLAQRNAEAFADDVSQGRYAGLSLRAPPASPGGRQGPMCSAGGHLLPPHFAFDPDVDSLLLKGIAPSTSIWDLHDELAQCRGFVALSWPRPGPGEAMRELRAHFATGGTVRGALAALTGLEAATPVLAAPSPELSALVAPPEMSQPERLRKDEALASRAVRLLDGLAGVRPELTEKLLKQEGTVEARLDLLVLYLRRVHHFCFYAAAWCEDEWDLRTRCGTAVLRDDSTDMPEGDWAVAHEKRLESFLANAIGARPAAPTRDEEPVAQRVAKLLEEQTVQVSEGKFRCEQCGKHFKAPHYVQKHMHKVHTDVLETVRQKALEEAARAACLADPCRPSLPVAVH